MKRNKILVILAIPIVMAFFSVAMAEQVPAEVKALAGVYEGTWSMFGMNEKGEIVPKINWTDIMEAKNPACQDGRAYVATVDTMTFEGGIPPQKMEGKEGYFLNPDGSLGDYFFESYGQVQHMVKLDDRVWVYTAPSSPMELQMLGFPAAAAAKHVVVKVVAMEDGVETHRISRVTTVTWKDKEGRDCSRQFLSLQGVHKRKK